MRTLLSSELDGPVDLLELALLILCRLGVEEVVSLLLEMLEGVEEVAAAVGGEVMVVRSRNHKEE